MSQEKDPTRFDLPLFRSLTEPIMFMGAPRPVIVLNLVVMFIFLISLHFIWIIPFNLAIHFGAIYITKQDPQAFDCLLIYLHQKKSYRT